MQFFNANQVAELLGVHKLTVVRAVRRGQFPRPIKLGKITRWSDEQIMKWARNKNHLAKRPRQRNHRARPSK